MTEHELKRRVVEELEFEPSLDAKAIRVGASEGAVSLLGSVDSLVEKVTAERVAKGVRDVQTVINELDVRIPLAHRRSDAELTEMVAHTLQWNVLVPRDAVRARVANAWVELGGTVDWQFQRAAAEGAVQVLVGVRGISNRIAVKPRVRAADIKTRIDTALRRRADLAALDAREIAVQAEDGKVVLRGQVHSWADRALVEAAAWAAPGVTTVEDELVVVADEPTLGL